MKYLIGIDLGTSSTKTILFDEDGKSICAATAEYPMIQPQNGWAEQDPAHWWEACVTTLRQVMERSGIPKEQVIGVGLSGQMHGLVMLDKYGAVLRNSIIWCDGRTAKECVEITEKVGAQRLIEITANPALVGFTAGKILWVREHEPELYARCRHILLPKDYLRYKLCNVFATEVSDASGMNLMDVPKRQWSKEVLEKLNIDSALLPSLHESCEVTGAITEETARQTGLAKGTPVVGGAGDNAAAAIGTGVVASGKAFTSIGTSGVIFAHSDTVTIDLHGRIHTFCSAVPGKWTVMSCTLAAGGSLQWFQNQFYIHEIQSAIAKGKDPYEFMDKLVEQVPIGSNRLLFLPYLMGERSPLLDPDARGVFFGLSGIHTRQDMLRAVMEGVGFSLRHCLDIFKNMGVSINEMLVTGGGGTNHLWRQILSDLYECPVVTINNREGPALGAAILAGVGTGLYQDMQKACNMIINVNTLQHPIAENAATYNSYFALYKDVYQSIKKQFSILATL